MEIEFKCSNGWLQRLKQQHNMSLTINGENSFVVDGTAEKWYKNVAQMVQQYTPHNIQCGQNYIGLQWN